MPIEQNISHLKALMKKLSKKVALVTGGSEGIGFSCALSLASEGCNLVLISRNKKKLKTAISKIKNKYKIKCLAIEGDVANPNLPSEALNIIRKQFNRLDILINNTGGPPMGSFFHQNDRSWDMAINQNLLSVIRFTHSAFSLMKRNKFGRVINILSVLAKEPTPQMVLSSTTRAAVVAFSKSISYDLGPHGITINNIFPGGVLTKRFESLLIDRAKQLNKTTKDFLKERTNTVPVGKFAKPNEIASIILFLCDKNSSIITGTSIIADGGQSKSI